MKYIVHFFEDNTRSFLAERYIRNFRATFFQLAFIRKTKNLRKLKLAISQACRLQCKRDSTFYKHVQVTLKDLNEDPSQSVGSNVYDSFDRTSSNLTVSQG